MLVMLPLLMTWMLLRAPLCMDAASAACRLFVQSVLPGLFPYMVLCLMLVSRAPQCLPRWLLIVLGWCGGSPTGARLLAMQPAPDQRTAVRCATMSPMFLLGTLGSWLHCPGAGAIILLSVLLGGYLAGYAAPARPLHQAAHTQQPFSFGDAVTSAAKTMLMVCGTMVMLRVLAALITEATDAFFPSLTLPITLLLEVTTGTAAITRLPLPLAWRTALLAGAAGIGGGAVLMQNRASYPPGFFPLLQQIAWQLLHGLLSGILALGMALMAGIV